MGLAYKCPDVAPRLPRPARAVPDALTMDHTRKILLVDDETDLLDIYQEVLQKLPGPPQITRAESGVAALAQLERNTFDLLITDLRMPRMDGLQLIAIVRRKYPALRTVVLTSLPDEQFRARVYALGVDLFWQKPATDTEMNLFSECIESMLERAESGGFRGLQSKSLMDILQLECLSQNSVVLRIINGPLHGRIWINQGELWDAEAAGLQGEEALLHILGWKAGTFESLPPEPDHPRTIQKSANALLLESAQAQDEARSQESDTDLVRRTGANPLRRLDGFEFLLPFNDEKNLGREASDIENAGLLADWARATLERFTALGDNLQAGTLDTVVALGRHCHFGLASANGVHFCAGWGSHLDAAAVRKSTKKAAALWVS